MSYVRRHQQTVGTVQLLRIVTFAPGLDVRGPEMATIEGTSDAARMLAQFEIRAENTLSVTCFEQVRFLCRANLGSLLNCHLSGILGQAPPDRLGDRSDYAFDFAVQERTE